jgi:hypothetical protein
MAGKYLLHDRRPSRERLLAAGDEIFYEEGVNLVGIDRVIERAGLEVSNSERSSEYSLAFADRSAGRSY